MYLNDHVIKISEARAILAHEGSLGYPLVKAIRDGNALFCTADPDEMALWRASQHTSGADK